MLSVDDKWWYGPPFFLKPKASWPQQRTRGDECQDTQREVKTPKQIVMAAIVESDVQPEGPEQGLENLINPSNYSKLQSLLRVT